MTLSPQWLDELRARTTLSAIIAPTVKLLKAGREFKACCPFHQEKTPSFTINDDKGFYHCFGCGAHGDAIRFLTEARGLPFMDAVKELAAKAGLDVPAPDPRAQEKAERTASLTDVMASVQAWFAEQLNGIEGGKARDYLKRRGIDSATVARFGIGLAPDSRTRLKQALAHLGEDKLVETGMLIAPESGGETYDRFRGRLMIPIRDPRGRVIGFGGRILGDGEPKYLNSPETVLFDKGRTLYNLDRAGPASRKANRLIVVEGYMDVIALDRAGIAEAVAPNGTAVTEAQLERMWRLEPAPILCFDGDSAGQKAAIRAALRALPHLGPERTLRFVELPAGQDPDDVVKSGGQAAMEALLANAESLDARLWRHEVAAQPLTTPEARAGLRQRLIDHSKAIADASLARLYRDEWLSRFDQEVGRKRTQFQPQKRLRVAKSRLFKQKPTDAERFLQSTSTTPQIMTVGQSGTIRDITQALVAGFVHFPQALARHCEQLADLAITDRHAAAVRDRLVDAAHSCQELDREQLLTILQSAGASADLDAVLGSGGIAFSFTRSDTDPALAARDLGVAVEALAASGEVELALLGATRRFESDMSEAAYAEQQRLVEAKQRLNQRLASLVASD